MARRTINDTFWTDPDLKALSFTNKALFLYFITNPHAHISGLYYLPLSTVTEETRLSMAEIKKGINSLSIPYPHTLYDQKYSVIWVRKMLQHQAFNPKIKINIEAHLKTLHKCPLIKDFLDYYHSLLIDYRYPTDTLPDSLSSSKVVNELMSERINELMSTTPLPPSKGGDVVAGQDRYFNFSPEDFMALYNKTLAQPPYDLSKCLTIDHKNDNKPNTKTRRQLIENLLQEKPDPEYWQTVFAKVAASKFLTGILSDKGWMANIDFIIRPGSHIKIMEGKYDDKVDWSTPGF